MLALLVVAEAGIVTEPVAVKLTSLIASDKVTFDASFPFAVAIQPCASIWLVATGGRISTSPGAFRLMLLLVAQVSNWAEPWMMIPIQSAGLTPPLRLIASPASSSVPMRIWL